MGCTTFTAATFTAIAADNRWWGVSRAVGGKCFDFRRDRLTQRGELASESS